MDIIFISKCLIIALLYFLVNYVYKKTDWHARGEKIWETATAQKFDKFLSKTFEINLDNLNTFILVIFWGLPVFISTVALGYIIVFQGFLEFFESREYWEQILFSFGLIEGFFSIQIYLDGKRIKSSEKDSLIQSQREKIYGLEKKIKQLEID